MISWTPRLVRPNLHGSVTRELALKILEAERRSESVSFPNEAELSLQQGVSRTVIREAMKVLVDKGMVEMRPKAGTNSTPRSSWKLLDSDILSWQAELAPDSELLLQLCEVRLAIEPTASGFAAVRATQEQLDEIARRLMTREALPPNAPLETVVDCDLSFFNAVIAASQNPLLINLNATIRAPFRTTLLYTFGSSTTMALELKAQKDLFRALHKKDPVAAAKAAERAVGMVMLAVQETRDAQKGSSRRGSRATERVRKPSV
jgi:DNA-binding FadR family transcriptional regulator